MNADADSRKREPSLLVKNKVSSFRKIVRNARVSCVHASNAGAASTMERAGLCIPSNVGWHIRDGDEIYDGRTNVDDCAEWILFLHRVSVCT